MVILSPNGEVAVWDVAARRPRFPPWRPDGLRCWSISLSPDGRHVATTTREGKVGIWHLLDGKQAALLRHPSWVYRASFSPDGNRVLTASNDATARVWRADGTGTPMVLHGHEAWLRSAAWSPDGTRIATTSGNTDSPSGIHTTRVWNADGSDKIVLEGSEHFLAWSPDSKSLITSSANHAMRVWRVDGSLSAFPLVGHDEKVRNQTNQRKRCSMAHDASNILDTQRISLSFNF